MWKIVDWSAPLKSVIEWHAIFAISVLEGIEFCGLQHATQKDAEVFGEAIRSYQPICKANIGISVEPDLTNEAVFREWALTLKKCEGEWKSGFILTTFGLTGNPNISRTIVDWIAEILRRSNTDQTPIKRIELKFELVEYDLFKPDQSHLKHLFPCLSNFKALECLELDLPEGLVAHSLMTLPPSLTTLLLDVGESPESLDDSEWQNIICTLHKNRTITRMELGICLFDAGSNIPPQLFPSTLRSLSWYVGCGSDETMWIEALGEWMQSSDCQLLELHYHGGTNDEYDEKSWTECLVILPKCQTLRILTLDLDVEWFNETSAMNCLTTTLKQMNQLTSLTIKSYQNPCNELALILCIHPSLTELHIRGTDLAHGILYYYALHGPTTSTALISLILDCPMDAVLTATLPKWVVNHPTLLALHIPEPFRPEFTSAAPISEPSWLRDNKLLQAIGQNRGRIVHIGPAKNLDVPIAQALHRNHVRRENWKHLSVLISFIRANLQHTFKWSGLHLMSTVVKLSDEQFEKKFGEPHKAVKLIDFNRFMDTKFALAAISHVATTTQIATNQVATTAAVADSPIATTASSATTAIAASATHAEASLPSIIAALAASTANARKRRREDEK